MPNTLPTPSHAAHLAGEPFLISRAGFDQLAAALSADLPPAEIRAQFLAEGNRWPEPQIIGRVAVLPVYGVLAPQQWPWAGTSTERLAMQFLAAIDSPDVDAIVFRINSPGGHARGVPELADLIYRHRGVKPIHAWAVNGNCDSGAYWIASACDRISATVSSSAGSVGVVLQHYETSQLESEVGITWTVLSMPEAKAHGNTHEPLSADARATIDNTILQPTFARFIEALSRNRAQSAEEIKANYGGGRSLPAADALAAGMIDDVGDWHEFLRNLAGEVSGTTRPPVEVRTMKFTAESKAILFAAGVIAQLDTSDDLCHARVAGFLAAKGAEMPADEAAVIAAIKQHTAAPAATPAAGAANAPAGNPAAEVSAAVAAAIQAETARRRDITARAGVLGLNVTDALVASALDDPNCTAATFADRAVAAAIESETPVGGRIESGPAALDRFAPAAANALFASCASMITSIANETGSDSANARQQFESLIDREAAAPCIGMSFLDIATEAVRLAGATPRERTPDGYAKAFLQLGGAPNEERRFAIGNPLIDGGLVTSALQGPGELPNLMDGFANKVVTFAIGMAPVTYHRWTTRTDDQPNFNPAQILTVSGPTEFAEHVDGKRPQQASIAESKAWLQVNEYSQARELTHRMVVQGQLAAFTRSLVFAQIGHERTINRLIVDLLLNNSAAPRDGVALFHANHSNIVSSGAGPSIAASKAMRKLLNAQPMPGDTEEGGLDLAIALVGSEWHTEALVNYDPAFRVTAQTQAEVNPFSGLITPIYDPMLSAGGKVWYGVANPAYLEGIVYAFQAGYGPGGRRVTYYDQATRCQRFDFYGSFGASLVNYEPFVRNPGE